MSLRSAETLPRTNKHGAATLLKASSSKQACSLQTGRRDEQVLPKCRASHVPDCLVLDRKEK